MTSTPASFANFVTSASRSRAYACVFLENKMCDFPWLEELGQDGLGRFADKVQFLLGIELRKGC